MKNKLIIGGLVIAMLVVIAGYFMYSIPLPDDLEEGEDNEDNPEQPDDTDDGRNTTSN